MSIAIEINRIHDLDDDHEVGGQDLPVEYTALVHGGTVAEALALMDADCGEFRSIEAFNIERISDTEVGFTSFVSFSVRRFEWSDSLEQEKLKTIIDGKVFHYIQRRQRVALMAAVAPRLSYFRGFWWERVHADPDLPQILDKHGHRVQPGQYCRFERRVDDRVLRGTGWIRDLSAHPIRPIAIVQDSEPQATFGIGLMPTEVEVLGDEAEIQAIDSILRAGVFPRDPSEWIKYSLGMLPEAGHPSMQPDDRARWTVQFPMLRAQFESLERLISSRRCASEEH
ncbi:hypothetical protein [Burkholderia multivorans]|uniref:hypothetical protein n=1 Tax=Burkholderia multivorans TaxID=87883 RepID=UPI001C2510C4|nr:hypothetical protein [Burkholderia multivorans]MBU9212404.1 hypothetical protein [Burkholderia multivorans]MBU9336692.1 hypothetical protein [Burkholderia multivorans]MBU9444537.1 hypothetical protein [Burkholderia multivorans]MCA8480194.1 hypothetical protein [Burkholderia multivorans]